MMYRFLYLSVAFVALATCAQIARAQPPADPSNGQNRPILDGSVESMGGRLQVS